MQMLNTKAFSLAMGIALLLMAAVSLLVLGSGTLAVMGIPQIDGLTAVVGTIVSLAIVFVEGAVFGAIVGWLYNKFQAEPRRSEDVDIFATS